MYDTTIVMVTSSNGMDINLPYVVVSLDSAALIRRIEYVKKLTSRKRDIGKHIDAAFYWDDGVVCSDWWEELPKRLLGSKQRERLEEQEILYLPKALEFDDSAHVDAGGFMFWDSSFCAQCAERHSDERYESPTLVYEDVLERLKGMKR